MDSKKFFRDLLRQNNEILFNYLDILGVKYHLANNGTEIRMSSIGSDNYSALSVNLEEMSYYDFKTTERGNIIDLLVKLTNKKERIIYLDLKKIIDNYSEEIKIENTKTDFTVNNKRKELLRYPKEILNLYPLVHSEIFRNDGIDNEMQSLFGIRYDKKSNRILLPVFFKGELVGLFGRINMTEFPKEVSKYFPILCYPKGEVLFGYDENKETIIEKKEVILVESEKSVIKAFQKEMYNVLAVGGSNVTKSHIKLLEELNVEYVFICFDSDKDFEKLKLQIQKSFRESNIKVYIVDNNTEFIKEKSCIFDMEFSKSVTERYINKFKYLLNDSE